MNYTNIKQVERNSYVDFIRGVAMLLVILGHTMTGCTEGAEKSFLFNIIWSLQMPLFFLVSGYVNRYSRKIVNSATLWSFVKRRTIAYLVPWLVWTFFVRGLIFKKTYFFNIKYLIYHMDIGYWFLTTIWIICLIQSFAVFGAEKIYNISYKRKIIVMSIIYGLGMIILAIIGCMMGMSFFGIRLTLYYMPFYFIGYLYGMFQDELQSFTKSDIINEIIVAICFCVWVTILVRFPLYALPDSISSVVIRAGCSFAGCIAISSLCMNLFNENETLLQNYLCCELIKIGKYSLEIYVTHYLFLSKIGRAHV